jgi:hypothetical protein
MQSDETQSIRVLNVPNLDFGQVTILLREWQKEWATHLLTSDALRTEVQKGFLVDEKKVDKNKRRV